MDVQARLEHAEVISRRVRDVLLQAATHGDLTGQVVLHCKYGSVASVSVTLIVGGQEGWQFPVLG